MATALVTKLHEINETLGLTQEDIASLVGSTPRSVSRWVSDEAIPQRLSRQRLIELAYVAEAVGHVMKRADANLWLFSPNRLLHHESPADRIRSGEFRTVIALIEALADGVVV